LNRPVIITQPNNHAVVNKYNKGGLLEKVQKGHSYYISNINYNARGQRTEIYFGNNSKTAYTYDDENFRLTRLLTTKNTGSVILQDLNYNYDSVGNIVEVQDDAQQTNYFNNSVIDPVSAYEYDALYRLTAATGRELTSLSAPGYNDFVNNIPNPNTATNAMQTYSHEYVYDKLGNILSDNWKDYFYDTATNRLLKHDEQGQPVYTYDAHGNMLTMPHLTIMIWDYKDELVSAGNGTVTSYYNYDAQGDRSRKIVVKPGGIVEERYYISGYEVYRKYICSSLDTERETVHIMDDRDRFVMIDTLTVENGITLTTPVETIRYQYTNHLGSACLELDSAAATISYEEYHPFGTTSYRSGRNEVDVSLKRYKYIGKERDEETGLYYYGARYYAAWIARFVSVDPLQHEYPHYTPYQYAGNKPITYIDLDGLEEAKKETVPTVTVVNNVIKISFKDKTIWHDKWKYDFVTNSNVGGGKWLYEKAKKDLGASPFGAAVVVAFAAEESLWGTGNNQKITHNMFSILQQSPNGQPFTPHGYVKEFDTFDENFDYWKDKTVVGSNGFLDLLTKDTINIDDINSTLKSGNYHVNGGYTDSNKGDAIINGPLRFVLLYLIDDLTNTLNLTNQAIELYEKKAIEFDAKWKADHPNSFFIPNIYNTYVDRLTEYKNEITNDIEELQNSYMDMQKLYNWN
jgi:RHS repeat-associated protein